MIGQAVHAGLARAKLVKDAPSRRLGQNDKKVLRIGCYMPQKEYTCKGI
jgi:hypothetical protein